MTESKKSRGTRVGRKDLGPLRELTSPLVHEWVKALGKSLRDVCVKLGVPETKIYSWTAKKSLPSQGDLGKMLNFAQEDQNQLAVRAVEQLIRMLSVPSINLPGLMQRNLGAFLFLREALEEAQKNSAGYNDAQLLFILQARISQEAARLWRLSEFAHAGSLKILFLWDDNERCAEWLKNKDLAEYLWSLVAGKISDSEGAVFYACAGNGQLSKEAVTAVSDLSRSLTNLSLEKDRKLLKLWSRKKAEAGELKAEAGELKAEAGELKAEAGGLRLLQSQVWVYLPVGGRAFATLNTALQDPQMDSVAGKFKTDPVCWGTGVTLLDFDSTISLLNEHGIKVKGDEFEFVDYDEHKI